MFFLKGGDWAAKVVQREAFLCDCFALSPGLVCRVTFSSTSLTQAATHASKSELAVSILNYTLVVGVYKIILIK